MISQAAFQIQVNRHLTATEWLINNSYAYWQSNADSWAELLCVFGSTLTRDAVSAARGLVQVAITLTGFLRIALYSVLVTTIQQANETVEEFVSERTDENAPASPEVSWSSAFTSILHQDIVAPVIGLWAVANIWESSLWLTLNRHI
jgi:hypothetical protein